MVGWREASGKPVWTGGEINAGSRSEEAGNVLWITVGAIAALAILGFLLFDSKAIGLSGGAIIAILLLMRLMPDFIKKPIDRQAKIARQYEQGAIGEEKVGQILSGLNDEYVVMHDWKSPYGNIDHIVYGKLGTIFMLETKLHYGNVSAVGDNLC